MGTAAVMLGASLALFAFVGTLVSFGAWPGLKSHENVDSLLVESVGSKVAAPLRISERPRSSRADARDRLRRATATPLAGTPTAGAPVTRVPDLPTAPAPAPAAGGDAAPQETTVAPAPRPTIERTAGELGSTVETVTEQTNEIVGEVGGQLQGPLDQVDRTVDGVLR